MNKVVRDIEIRWQSTPRLWLARRDACGCGEHNEPHGLGKTPYTSDAVALQWLKDRGYARGTEQEAA